MFLSWFIALLFLNSCNALFGPKLAARICRGVACHAITDISSVSMFDELLHSVDSNKLVLIDYSTTWCGPCTLAYPKFLEFSERYPEVVFAKCVGDTSDVTGQLMKREGIRSVPAFHFWKGNKKVQVITGAKMDEVEAAIKSFK